MTRNLKALGLALVAVFALSALAASSASAVDTVTVSGGGTANVTASGSNNIFEITTIGLTVACSKAHFTGTATNGSKELTVTPAYSGTIAEPNSAHCNASLGTATIDSNHCHYVLTGNTTNSDAGSADAVIWVECDNTGEHIVITSSTGCEIKVPAQTPTSGGVTYQNNTPVAGKVQVTATSTGITYTTNNVLACKLAKVPAEGNDSDYTGSVIAESTTAGKTIEISGS